MKKTFFLISILVFSILFSKVPMAQRTDNFISTTSAKPMGITFAIIIGISDYHEAQDLQFAHKDAINFADILYSRTDIQVDSANLIVLLNDKATGINIGSAFSQVYKNTLPGDQVYIFFAGHGDIEMANPGNNGLLLLYKAPKNSYFAFGSDYLHVVSI